MICERCGADEQGRYIEETRERLERKRRCFSCDFWEGYAARADDPASIRIDGNHYMVAPEDDDPRGFRGFGGRTFVVRFSTGREITTTHLWTQGCIPPLFRGELPNNAVFVSED